MVGDGGGAGGGDKERGTNELKSSPKQVSIEKAQGTRQYVRDQRKQQGALLLMPAQFRRLRGGARDILRTDRIAADTSGGGVFEAVSSRFLFGARFNVVKDALKHLHAMRVHRQLFNAPINEVHDDLLGW